MKIEKCYPVNPFFEISILLMTEKEAANMKKLDNVTLVNNPMEIFELFTQLFPEMKPMISGWEVWKPFTDSFRGILLAFSSEMRLIFSIRR